jgi:N-acetylglutamate synthase-like GNAT family acetyltransferase
LLAGPFPLRMRSDVRPATIGAPDLSEITPASEGTQTRIVTDSSTDMTPEMRDYEIVETNADNIGGCSLCGNKAVGNLGHRRKTAWLRERYAEGLRYKVVRSQKFGEAGMIEYAVGNQAWRPVEAEGYLVIHCLMVHAQHKGKGLGRLLLDSCLRDAKKSKCHGVAVVTSSDALMARSAFFIKAGFVRVDSAPPYELLVKKLKQTAPDPRFIVQRERALKRYKKGLAILAADQCPYVPKSVERIVQAARALGLKPRVVRIRSAQASRELPTPYGVFSIIHDGRLMVERPISATRFTNIMLKRGTQRGMPMGLRSAHGGS